MTRAAGAEVEGADGFKDPGPAKARRVIYDFDVPVSIGGGIGVEHVGIVALSPKEERLAATRSKGDPMALSVELWKESLREVNHSPVSLGDGSADIWIEKFSPKLRTLCMSAYSKVNQPDDDEVKDFFKSMKVRA